MALTFVDVNRNYEGNRSKVLTDVTFDASYPTGGEPIVAADVGLTVIENIVFPPTDGTNMYRWDETNAKILAYVFTTQAQVANAVDLSASTVRCEIAGY